MIQPVKEKIILGIDPGTNIMGYGVLKVTGVKSSSRGLGSDRPEKMYRSVLEIEAYLRTGAGSDFLLSA